MGKINDDTGEFSKAKESQPRTEKQSLEPSSDRGIGKCVIMFIM